MKEAQADYERQKRAYLATRTQEILREHRQRDRAIRREGARMAWLTCPFAILLLSAVAWLNFHQGDMTIGAIMAVGALAFLVMLVLAHRGAR